MRLNKVEREELVERGVQNAPDGGAHRAIVPKLRSFFVKCHCRDTAVLEALFLDYDLSLIYSDQDFYSRLMFLRPDELKL